MSLIDLQTPDAGIVQSDFIKYLIMLCPLQIPKRLMLALSLLKKEYELSKLQQRIGREVMLWEAGWELHFTGDFFLGGVCMLIG